jgi:hypothetical protein
MLRNHQFRSQSIIITSKKGKVFHIFRLLQPTYEKHGNEAGHQFHETPAEDAGNNQALRHYQLTAKVILNVDGNVENYRSGLQIFG